MTKFYIDNKKRSTPCSGECRHPICLVLRQADRDLLSDIHVDADTIDDERQLPLFIQEAHERRA